MKFPQTVRSRVRLISFLLVTLPLLIVILVFSLSERRKHLARAEAQLVQTLEYQKLLIERWMEDRERDAQYLSTLPFVVEQDLARVEDYFSRFVEQRQDIYAAVYVDANGLTRVDQAPQLNIDVSDRAYFRQAKEGKSWISDMLIGRQSGKSIIIFSSPVTDADGAFLGLVFCPVTVDTLVGLVTNFKFQGGVTSVLVDAQGVVLPRAPEAVSYADELQKLGEGTYYGDHGQKVVGASMPLQYNSWRLFAEIPVSTIMDGFHTQLYILLAASLATILLMTPFILRFINSISSPLRHIAIYADAVRKGESPDACPQPPDGAPTEIRTLHKGVCAMVELLEDNVSKFKTLSNTDQLTGLCNRRHLEDEGERMAATCLRASTPCSCLMIDIDHFKSLNDAFGHAVGDDALRFVASIIKDCCRTSDLAARYGGEEFTVIAPNATARQSLTLAERILTTIRESPVVTPDTQFHLSVSIGLAELSTEMLYGVSPFEDMLSKADKALYASKTAGRDRSTLFGDIQWPPPRT